jgi:RNA polymerase sigma-70 factor (ECF subfamily)
LDARVSGTQEELVSLMLAVANGDRRAFATLFERTSAKLNATIRRILRSEAAAEDALQEAFVRIWRRAGDFDPGIASPIAWMTTIARHAAIDMLRRGAERVSAAGEAIDADLAERLADPAGGVERLATGDQLRTCLDQLEADRRGMVLLAYCYGWSREELASRFDRPVATVKTILRRSLIVLKECLGGGR